MRPYLLVEHPLRFAHRGGSLLWPENTSVAFDGAVELGYRYIETDVRVSRDHVAMVFHDATLERTTNAAGPIAEWWYEDLRRLDTAYHFKPEEGHPLRGTGVGMLSLIEALERYPAVRFNLDLKSDDAPWAVAAALEATEAHERVMVGSFSDRRLRRFRRVTAGSVATSAGPAEVVRMWTASRRGLSARRPCDAYQVPARLGAKTVVDRRFVEACHAADSHVHVWTVNDATEIRRLLALGVDGIVTDRPDLLNEVLDA